MLKVYLVTLVPKEMWEIEVHQAPQVKLANLVLLVAKETEEMMALTGQVEKVENQVIE